MYYNELDGLESNFIDSESDHIINFINGFESMISQYRERGDIYDQTGFESYTKGVMRANNLPLTPNAGFENFVTKGLSKLWEMVKNFFKNVFGFFFGKENKAKKIEENNKEIKDKMGSSEKVGISITVPKKEGESEEDFEKRKKEALEDYAKKLSAASSKIKPPKMDKSEGLKIPESIKENKEEIPIIDVVKDVMHKLSVKYVDFFMNSLGSFKGIEIDSNTLNITVNGSATLDSLLKFNVQYSELGTSVTKALNNLKGLETKLKSELESGEFPESTINKYVKDVVECIKIVGNEGGRIEKYQTYILELIKEKEGK